MELGNLGQKPGDVRGFFHKKILNKIGIGGIITGGLGIASTIFGRKKGGGSQTPATFVPTKTFREAVPGGRNGSGACPSGTRPDPRGFCVSPRSAFGQRSLGGQAVEGLYGPAFVPDSQIRDVAMCPKGMALGKDDLCYMGLSNKLRKYPRGRRPLLSGGDMRAISKARTAGNRLANAKSDLIAIGMLKASGPRRRKKKAVATC